MPYAVEFATFYLKKTVSQAEFMAASDILNSGFLKKQKGYVSRKLLINGGMYCDYVLWETLDDAKTAVKNSQNDPIALGYMSKLIFNKKGCSFRHYLTEKEYCHNQLFNL